MTVGARTVHLISRSSLTRIVLREVPARQAILDIPLAISMGLVLLDVLDAGLLFHIAFLMLAANAFLRGLRSTIRRLIVVTIALAIFVTRSLMLHNAVTLDLAEWPLMMLIALLVAWLAERRDIVARHYAQLYEKVAGALTSALESERKRLARELHDSLGQVYASLTMTLDAADAALTQGRAEPALEAIREARRLSADALDATRDLANELRPENLVEGGLPFAVETRARRLIPGARIELSATGYGTHRLSPICEAEFYRCVVEALVNVARHARARNVRIELAEHDGGVLATVQDDGVGFESTQVREGLGIIGIRERAALLNGDVRVSSRPGKGTTVRILIPTVRREADAPA